MLRAFYKDTSLFVRTDGGDSAQIYLSRGFFQGDVFSPDAATLMSVLLIRMLKYSGCFCEHSSGDGKKLVNAVVFADDSTLVVTGDTNFEIQQRAQKLLDTVAQFADFAATALNLGKSFATGRDFGRDQELHVRLTFRGDTVPSVPSGKSFRCLGVQFNCRLNGIEGKQLILQQTRSLVAMLRKHFHDADQIDRVMRTAIIPIFRYSSPLLGWTERELNQLHQLWVQGFKAAYGLSPGTANALLTLPQSCGGVGVEHPFTYLLRECVGALNQMLGVRDTFCDLCKYRSQRELFDLGAASVAEAQEDLVLAHTPTTRYESPFLFALYLSRRLRYMANWTAFVGDRELKQTSLLSFSSQKVETLCMLSGRVCGVKTLGLFDYR